MLKNSEFKNIKLKLAGSESLASQIYYADYDFLIVILKDENKQLYTMHLNAFSHINEKLYCIEFKIE